jgi:hypothetical protein
MELRGMSLMQSCLSYWMTIRSRRKIAIAVGSRNQKLRGETSPNCSTTKLFAAIHGIIFTLRNGATAKYCARMREFLLTHLPVVDTSKGNRA